MTQWMIVVCQCAILTSLICSYQTFQMYQIAFSIQYYVNTTSYCIVYFLLAAVQYFRINILCKSWDGGKTISLKNTNNETLYAGCCVSYVVQILWKWKFCANMYPMYPIANRITLSIYFKFCTSNIKWEFTILHTIKNDFLVYFKSNIVFT